MTDGSYYEPPAFTIMALTLSARTAKTSEIDAGEDFEDYVGLIGASKCLSEAKRHVRLGQWATMS